MAIQQQLASLYSYVAAAKMLLDNILTKNAHV